MEDDTTPEEIGCHEDNDVQHDCETNGEIQELQNELERTKANHMEEILALKKELEDTKLQLTLQSKKQIPLTYGTLRNNAKKFKYFTGIDVEKFDAVFETLKPYFPEAGKSKILLVNQFLLTLIKLRLNLQIEALADLYNVSKTTVNDVFWRWVDLLYEKLKFLIKWPDHDASMETLPHVFRQYFPRLTGIIDCTEVFIHRPKSLKARAQVYSNYKKHSTLKFLVACTPQGAISYLSKAWGGRISDVELVKQCGFISRAYHHAGDQILADRGFTLQDEFAAGAGVELIIPAFTRGKSQLSAEDVETTRQIASIRIHIEQVIGLLKNRFNILSSGPLPLTMIKSLSDETMDSETTSIDKIVTVCAILVNLGDGIVYNE